MLEHLASFARIFSHQTAYSIFYAKWYTLPLMDNGTIRRKEIILGALYVSNTVLIFTMGRIAAASFWLCTIRRFCCIEENKQPLS